MRSIVLVVHNVRSCHNVGSLLRTAEGLGVQKVFLTGYTPYPLQVNDPRLPHISRKLDAQIHKTALGAEKLIPWEHTETVEKIFRKLRTQSYTIMAIEQSPTSTPLPEYVMASKVALIIGREVEGIEPEVLGQVDKTLEIPMFGKKESFNVVQAAAMALYQARFSPDQS